MPLARANSVFGQAPHQPDQRTRHRRQQQPDRPHREFPAEPLVKLGAGESDSERSAGTAVAVVAAQLDRSLPHAGGADGGGAPKRLAVAYEPIWAIGTGKVPSIGDIGEMHGALRGRLIAAYGGAGEGVRILYGGSVKAGNAAEIFAVPDVDGALVGGASLTPGDFIPIVEAAVGLEGVGQKGTGQKGAG